jgi:hypothetical protein
MARRIRPPRPLWSSSSSVRDDVANSLKGKRVNVRYSAHRDADRLESVVGTLAAVGPAYTGAQGRGDFVAIWVDLIDGRPPESGRRYRDVFLSLATVHSIELAPITAKAVR